MKDTIGYRKKTIYKFLLLLTIASAIGLQGWRTLFNNFAVDEVVVDGFWIGIIQSIREVPGFLALLVVFILLIIKEHRLSSVSVLILGVGIASVGLFPSNLGLIFTTLIMSTGFHYFETTNQSLTLQHFDKRTAVTVLGRLKSIGALANIGIGISIWVLTSYLSLTILFLLIGILVIIMSLRSFFIDPSDSTLPRQNKKMILRKRYFLFYLLNFLSGARRQIFVVFAVFLLVDKNHFAFSVQLIAILFVVNNIINYFLTPLIAKGINKFGERKVLSLEYASLILIFIGYTYVKSPLLVGLLYVLDHIFFNFSMGIKTFFQKTADPKDIAPSMAVSFTINHLTAVFFPFLGGVLWLIDFKIPFLIGAFLSIISLIAVQFIKIEKN